jgi:hypothetical protein
MAASALTFVQIINRVLERLRESAVTNYNDTDYSTFIAGIVNQVKSEIEDATYWHQMRETFSVSTTNNTSQYSLTGSQMNAVIIDAWNTTVGLQLSRGSVAGFNSKFFGVGSGNSVQTGSPTEYLPAGYDVNFDVVVDVWPIPVTGKLDTLKFNAYVPQADLAANATVPLVPQNVLIEETIARALLERGDEGAAQPDPSTPGGKFIRTDLLSQAVIRNQGADPTETDWEPE